MERALGIGGPCFGLGDPVARTRWRRDALGTDEGNHVGLWEPEDAAPASAPTPSSDALPIVPGPRP